MFDLKITEVLLCIPMHDLRRKNLLLLK